MPKIPVYERQINPSGAGQNVGMDNTAFNAAGAWGKGVKQFTDEFSTLIAQQADDLKKRDNAIAKADLTNKANKYLIEQKNDYDLNANKSDSITGLTDYSNNRNKNLPIEFRNLIGIENIKDPDVRVHAEELARRVEENFLFHTSQAQSKIRKSFADKAIGDAVQNSVTSAMSGASIETSLSDTEKIIQEMHNTGVLNLDESADTILKAQQEVVKAGLEYLEKNDQKQFISVIESGKYNHILGRQAKEYQKQAQTVQHDQILTETYAKLYNKYNGDFNKMNEALSLPDVQKEFGLTLEDSFYIKNQISNAQTDQDKADQSRWNKNATDVFVNLNNITPGEIDRKVLRGEISYQQGEHFKDEKKQAQEGTTDPYAWYNTYTQIKDAAGDADKLLKLRNKIFATPGISFSDKKTLLSMTEKDSNQYESQLEKKGLDYIKAVVMPSQTMISAAKPMEAQKFLEAGMAYEKALANVRQKGEVISGDVIERISKEIALNYSTTVYENMDYVRDKMKKDKEKRNAPKSNQPAFDVTVRKAPYAGAQLTDQLLAANYVRAANGDRNKARQLAKMDGWVF